MNVVADGGGGRNSNDTVFCRPLDVGVLVGRVAETKTENQSPRTKTENSKTYFNLFVFGGIVRSGYYYLVLKQQLTVVQLCGCCLDELPRRKLKTSSRNRKQCSIFILRVFC